MDSPVLHDPAKLEANLRALCEQAPPTTCGACRIPMPATWLYLHIGFNWDNIFPDPPTFTPYEPTSFRLFSGDIEYECPRCQTTLKHRQQVSLQQDGFHFTPPQEEYASK